MRKTGKYRSSVRMAAVLLLLPAVVMQTVPAIAAGPTLPKPYVSRGLDATLIPIDPAVRAAFRLAPAANGVLVLAVKPNGVAARSNIKPGDVIGKVRGHAVTKPSDIDASLLFWIGKGVTDFLFDSHRGNKRQRSQGIVTRALYYEPLDVRGAGAWTAVAAVSGFSYASYYSETVSETVTTYESIESTIEESISSEEYAETVTDDFEDVADDADYVADDDDDADADDDDADVDDDDADEGDEDDSDDADEDEADDDDEEEEEEEEEEEDEGDEDDGGGDESEA